MNNAMEYLPSLGRKLGFVGFLVMLSGPTVFILANILFDTLPKFIAYTFMWAAIVLPGIGFALSIISLVLDRKSDARKSGFAIFTIIMCNPFFYFIYFFICGMMGSALAGMPSM
jgi:hypothetical protein